MRSLFGPGALAAGLLACTPAPVATSDAGTDAPPLDRPDVYRPPPPPYTCDGAMTHVDGVLGETATVMLDTTMVEERPRDLGPACGNVETTADWARQAVVEYVVPGTGRVGLFVDTRFPETALGFNTVVQVRTACDTIPMQVFPPTCFDDSSGTEARAAGGVMVDGGSTLYLIVTGYSDPPAAAMQIDEGAVRLDVTTSINTAPVISDGSVVLVDDAALFQIVADDAEGPITAYAFGLITPRGRVDFDGDGDADSDDVVVFPFDSVSGTGPYTGDGTITPAEDGYQIATFCRAAGCTTAILLALDEMSAISTEISVPVLEAMYVGRDQPCDRTHVCLSGLRCVGGICIR